VPAPSDPKQPEFEAVALAWDGTSPLDPQLAAWLEQAEDGAPAEVATRRRELWCLLVALGHADRCESFPGFVSGQPFRAGYRLAAVAGEPGQIEPSFAHALAVDLPVARRSEWFDHLWGVDLGVWRGLKTLAAKELARLWLTSPGRRLVQDLEFLRVLHVGRRDGATDVSPERVAAASGADVEFADAPPGWLDLHTAVPGATMRRWAPKDSACAVAVAFHRLESGSPYSLRGAALGWLLGRAIDAPVYAIGEVRSDLREDLPARLALAFSARDRPAAEVIESSRERFSAQVEEVLLQHAALVVRRDPAGDRVRRAWHIARWIHGCVIRSPFYRGDDERLHADLLALLPPGVAAPGSKDPLDPARFGVDRLRVDDVALVAGAWAHYGRPGEHFPPPPPLTSALRRLAARATNPAERDAEAAFRGGRSNQLGRDAEAASRGGRSNQLEWDAQYFAPPWLARWLLTQWRVRWLADATPEARTECLAALRDDRDLEWLAHVWQAEGATLPAAARGEALAAWRALRDAARTKPPHALASMALGLLDLLDAEERAKTLATVSDAQVDWRPFLLDAWAKSALDLGDPDLASAARGGLLTLAGDARVAADVRRNAALMLVRRAVGAPADDERLRGLAALAAHPPLSDHPGLLRELRRLGVLPATTRGTHGR